MTKHTPATPLPWETYCVHNRNAIMARAHIFAEVQGPDYRRDPADAAYIAHAANAYPKLVEALLDLTAPGMDKTSLERQAVAILRELGETK